MDDMGDSLVLRGRCRPPILDAFLYKRSLNNAEPRVNVFLPRLRKTFLHARKPFFGDDANRASGQGCYTNRLDSVARAFILNRRKEGRTMGTLRTDL